MVGGNCTLLSLQHCAALDQGDRIMISAYTGTPGSGKSLHSANRIYWRLKTGKPVITNFPINIPKNCKKACHTYVDNAYLTPDYLINYSRQLFGDSRVREGSILLVVDEAQLLWNCREWKGEQRAAWTSFFTQHRKLGYDVIMIMQFLGMVDKQLRCLVEYEEIHRKVSNMGIKGKFLSVLLLSPSLFVAVRVWATLNERLSSEFFRYSRRLGNLYNTYAEFSAPPSAEEIKSRNSAELPSTGWVI